MSSMTDRRAAMVDRLRADGVTDPLLLDAMRGVPRERFVSPDHASEAYLDAPLDIGLGQTISSPWIVAYSIDALQLPAQSHVLEVGAGSGYGAAVMSRRFQSVVTVERYRELTDRAREILSELGYDNVDVRAGDGTTDAADRAPYDGIIVTAMAPGELPKALLDQLAPGGVLVCPVGDGSMGQLMRYRDGRSEALAPVAFVPLVTN